MSNTDLVSVLMPAFKPEFLKEALLSVVNQTHENMEILVGDNSGRGSVRIIIEEINDPRITYIPTYQVTNQSPKLNHMILWWRAKGRYTRFVYDDDIIQPRSSEVLLDQIKKVPGCALAWHQREIINETGSVIAKLDFIGQLENVFLNRSLLLDNLIKHQNFIGEPSFVLFDRTVFKNFNFSNYAGVDMVFHWDVPIYLEAAKHGLLAGNGQFLGYFRKHSNQMSSMLNEMFVPLEWELILRNEHNEKNLSQENFDRMLATVLYTYETRQGSFPVLGEFREKLIEDLQKNRLFESTQIFIDFYNTLALSI